jgi:hypothetical protein
MATAGRSRTYPGSRYLMTISRFSGRAVDPARPARRVGRSANTIIEGVQRRTHHVGCSDIDLDEQPGRAAAGANKLTTGHRSSSTGVPLTAPLAAVAAVSGRFAIFDDVSGFQTVARAGQAPRAVTPSAMALVPMSAIGPVNPQFPTYCCTIPAQYLHNTCTIPDIATDLPSAAVNIASRSKRRLGCLRARPVIQASLIGESGQSAIPGPASSPHRRITRQRFPRSRRRSLLAVGAPIFDK